MKVLINKCFGGFGVSTVAIQWLRERGHEGAKQEVLQGEKYDDDGSINQTDYNSWSLHGTPRHDPLLIECVETLGSTVASGSLGKLKVVEIPDGIEYEIDEYDGMESIHQVHESWG